MKSPAATFLAFVAGVAAIYLGRGLLLPILLAIFIAILLFPAVSHLRRLYVPEPLAAGIVVISSVLLVVAALYGLSGPLQEWADRMPRLAFELQFRLRAVQEALEQMRDFAQQIEAMTEGRDSGNGEKKPEPTGPDVIQGLLRGARSTLVTLLTSLVLVYFLLAQGSRLSDRIFQALPPTWYDDSSSGVGETLRVQVNSYLRTFTLINIALGTAVGLAMWGLGLPDPVLWGVFAGVLNFLPYVGPLIVFIVIGGVSLLTFNTWGGILAPPLVFLVINGLEGSVITPHLVGRAMRLNPIAIFISVLFWTWAWGAVGALLAVPTLAVLSIATDHLKPIRRLQPLLR